METLVKEYEPEAPASHHTRSRNTLVFSDCEQLRPEHRDHPARYRFCLDFLTPEDTVLDCASGCGYGSAILAEQCASVSGVELHQDLVDYAQANWSRDNIEHHVFDVCSGPLPFADDAFSAIVSLETIEHVSNPRRLLAEFRRVLKPNGLLLLSTPQAPMGNPHHIHEFTLGELCRALEDSGFPLAATYMQQGTGELLAGAAPIAGRQNFVVAGKTAGTHPINWIVDEQYKLLRGLRRQHEEAQTQLEETRRQAQAACENGEQLLAGAMLEMRRLQSEIRDISHLPGIALCKRFAGSAPYRLWRKCLRSEG